MIFVIKFLKFWTTITSTSLKVFVSRKIIKKLLRICIDSFFNRKKNIGECGIIHTFYKYVIHVIYLVIVLCIMLVM